MLKIDSFLLLMASDRGAYEQVLSTMQRVKQHVANKSI